MVNLYVGITDEDWFRFLSTGSPPDEVNFWQPGGSTQFRALQPGELFLFKLHSPRNFIVGGGIFAHSSIVPLSLAWDAFGTKNGASSLTEMRQRIAKYRRDVPSARSDYSIGCRIIESPFFFPEFEWIPVPETWSRNIVVGKTYSTDSPEGASLWAQAMERASLMPPAHLGEEAPRFGAPRLIAPRLGQGTFRVAVTDAYGRRCAVTGERTLPALDAAHIRPFADGGRHEIGNGLLLRSDLHRLFDSGYVTITTGGRFEVSKRIRDEFDNGKVYYALQGHSISRPGNASLHPQKEAVEWHNENVFRG